MFVTSVKTGRDTSQGRSEEQGARVSIPAGHTCAVEKRPSREFHGLETAGSTPARATAGM